MALAQLDWIGSSGGGGIEITGLSDKYTTPQGNNAITNIPISVTEGKYYIVTGILGHAGTTNTYSVSGGELLGYDYGNYSSWGNDVISVILLIKATSSSITITIPSGGYTGGLYSGTVQEIV